MGEIVCFTSDFGLDDGWVGVCHAVIARTCADAVVVDLSHLVPPYDIRKGAAVASAGVFQLPEAIHLVVVDPGVGGGRRDLCIVAANGTRLVGPDNGVLVPAARRCGGISAAYSIDPDLLGADSVHPTFHARDLLAPAAAVLASGRRPEDLGEAVSPDTLAPAPFPAPSIESGALVTQVVDIDRFGSVRTAITADDLEGVAPDGGNLEVAFGHLLIEVPLAHTFSDVAEGDPVVLFDSSGWLTLAVRAGNAAERYGLEPGATARVRSRP